MSVIFKLGIITMANIKGVFQHVQFQIVKNDESDIVSYLNMINTGVEKKIQLFEFTSEITNISKAVVLEETL